MDLIDEYKQKLNKLENYLDFAVEVSNACGGLKNVPWELVRANQLFIRMTVTCLSSIRLLPFNRYFPVENEFWDLHSILSLSRNFVETYLMLWYVAVEDVCVEERKLRLKILNYHLNNEKYKLYKEFGVTGPILLEFEQKLPIEKEEIGNNKLFNDIVLDKNRRNNILKGIEAKYLSNFEITERVSFKTDEFKPLYRWFSNHAHSSPFAIFSLNEGRGNGTRNDAEVLYINMALDFMTKYLLIAIVDTLNLFPSCITSLDTDKLHIIREEFIIYSQNLSQKD